MRKIAYFAAMLIALASCNKKTMHERIQEDVEHFNRVEAPKRMDQWSVLDSLGYIDSTNTLQYYYHVDNLPDDMEIDSTRLADVNDELREALLATLRGNIKLKPYKDADVTFQYIYYMEHPTLPLFAFIIPKEDYK